MPQVANLKKAELLAQVIETAQVAQAGLQALLQQEAPPALIPLSPTAEKYRKAHALDELHDRDTHFVKNPIADLIQLAQEALELPSLVDSPEPSAPAMPTG